MPSSVKLKKITDVDTCNKYIEKTQTPKPMFVDQIHFNLTFHLMGCYPEHRRKISVQLVLLKTVLVYQILKNTF